MVGVGASINPWLETTVSSHLIHGHILGEACLAVHSPNSKYLGAGQVDFIVIGRFLIVFLLKVILYTIVFFI